MKLYFYSVDNGYVGELVSTPSSQSEAQDDIIRFCDSRNYNVEYFNLTLFQDYIRYDVGYYHQFFHLYE